MVIGKDKTRILVTLPRQLHQQLKADAITEVRSVNNLITKILQQHYSQRQAPAVETSAAAQKGKP